MLTMRKFFGYLMLLFSTVFYSCDQKAAYIRPNPLFTDHMVLQRNIEVPIWGKAEPRGEITIKIGNDKFTTIAAADSSWQVTIPPQKAGGPYTIEVIGEETILFKDIMFGDVWICSGQSNMDWPVKKAANDEDEIKTANFPEIRLFKANYTTSRKLLSEIDSEGWQQCSPATIPDFSAVGYFFGREIHEKIDVPIGLIHIAWGGTPAEAWMSKEALAAFPAFKNEIDAIESINKPDEALKVGYEKEVQIWESQLLSTDTTYPIWTQTNFDDKSWRRAYLPAKLEDIRGIESTGVFWFRTTIELDEEWDKNSLKVSLGKISNMDHFFWNGKMIGFTERGNQVRTYEVPPSLVKKENTLILRITNLSGSGGIMDNYRNFALKDGKGKSMLLAGYWRYAPSMNIEAIPKKPNNPLSAGRPTVLFKSMVKPLVPFAMRGIIWYQGESNASRANQYKTLFPALIKDWRNQWAQAGSNLGNFPFLYVQLANFLKRDQIPKNDPWPQLREAQLQTLTVPNTGMAVAIDLGETDDIHPKNKQDVGKRLALNALSHAYNRDLIYSGPIYQSMVVEEGQIRITFSHIGDGLQIGNSKNTQNDRPEGRLKNRLKSRMEGRLKGFAIAGSNQQFVWANARIEGETVVVKSNLVTRPVAVRYAWSNNPDCNLYNKNGLPASPFRTDEFE